MENKKEKVAFLACDIEGTITHGLWDEEESQNAYMVLPELLELIRKAHSADKLVFSYFTGSDKKLLDEYIPKIAQYFVGTNIVMGNHYCKDKCVNQNGVVIADNLASDKIDSIGNEVEKLMDNADVTWIGFADNDLNRHQDDTDILEQKYPGTVTATFKPVEVVQLVQQLAQYLNMTPEDLESLIPTREMLDFDNPMPKSGFNL